MDPVSALGLAQQCFDLTRAVIQYIEAVKGAPAERLILANEMQNIGNLVKLLEKLNILGGGRSGLEAGFRVSDEISGPLQRMVKRMNGICSDLGIDAESKRHMSHFEQKLRETARNLKWPFKQEQVVEHLNALERDKSIMTLYLQGHNYMLSKTTQESIGDVQTDLTDLLDAVKIIGDQVGDISSRDLNQETRDLLRWLSPLDFASRQRHLCEDRKMQDRTGTWFLDTPQVRSWLAGDQRLVYATGVAGSGKTMLASITVQHLRQHMPDTPVAFAFFDHKSQSDYSLETILANVLRQLLQGSGEIPQSLRHTFERSRGPSGEPPLLEEVLVSLRTVLSSADNVYIVLDAMDEFSTQISDRRNLLEELLRLDATESMHIMVTCRSGQSSHKVFEDLEAVTIKAHVEDVRSYLRPRVNASMPQFILQSGDLKTQMIDSISVKVQDMFVLARYHLQAVRRTRNRKGLLKALEELPTGSEGLDQLYGRCLDRVDQHSPDHRNRLYRMLDLLICCRRALTPLEIVEALALDIESVTLDRDDRVSIEDLIIDAEGLVNLDDKGEVVGFAHETVYKHISTRDEAKGIEARVAELCMRYLSLARLRKEHSDYNTYHKVIHKRHPFFNYAATYWGDHAKHAIQGQPEFVDQVLHFLSFPYRACDGWTGKMIMESAISRGMAIWKGRDFDRGGHHKTTARAKLRLPPAQHAVYFGLFPVVRRLLDEGVEVNATDPEGKFLTLNAAVQSQRIGMTKLLLERGADPNRVANSHAPLNWAAESSSLEMVQLLVERGADVDKDNQNVDPPLCTACERDRGDVVEYLIQKGANLDNCSARVAASYRTPLSYVLDKGRPKCREMLLFQYRALTPERGHRLLAPMEDAGLVQRLIEEAGTLPHQTFGLGHSALDVALRLRTVGLLTACVKHHVQPRIYWDLDADKDLVRFLEVHAPDLRATLVQQRPPTLIVQREIPEGEGWKADDAQAKRIFISFAVPSLADTEAAAVTDDPPSGAPTSRQPPTKKAASISKIMFDITSHDQGHSSYPHDHGTYHGGDSEFFAEIADGAPSSSSSSSVVAKARPKVVQNVHADARWKRHVVVWDRSDGGARAELGQWFEEASEGRVVRVVAQGGGKGWENWVRRVAVWVWVDW